MGIEIAGTELAAGLVTAARAGYPRSGGIHFLNTTIVPAGVDGVWEVATVDEGVARWLMSLAAGYEPEPALPVVSHVGHAATAAAFGEILGRAVEVDRTPWTGEGVGLVLQLNGRIAEGTILTREEMDRIGYTLRVIFRRSEGAEFLTPEQEGCA